MSGMDMFVGYIFQCQSAKIVSMDVNYVELVLKLETLYIKYIYICVGSLFLKMFSVSNKCLVIILRNLNYDMCNKMNIRTYK